MREYRYESEQLERCSRLYDPQRPTRVLNLMLIRLLRNGKVFRQEEENNAQVARRCTEDLLLWANRCNNGLNKQRIIDWGNNLLVRASMLA